jgi:hypothetical protein
LGRFPEPEKQEQPWRKIWKAPPEAISEGKLLVACPKKCVYGKFKYYFSSWVDGA